MITEIRERIEVNLAAPPGPGECPLRLYRGVLIAIVPSISIWAALIWAVGA